MQKAVGLGAERPPAVRPRVYGQVDRDDRQPFAVQAGDPIERACAGHELRRRVPSLRLLVPAGLGCGQLCGHHCISGGRPRSPAVKRLGARIVRPIAACRQQPTFEETCRDELRDRAVPHAGHAPRRAEGRLGRRRAVEQLAGRSVWCIAAAPTETPAADALEHCLCGIRRSGSRPVHGRCLQLREPLIGLMERIDAMLRGVTLLGPRSVHGGGCLPQGQAGRRRAHPRRGQGG